MEDDTNQVLNSLWNIVKDPQNDVTQNAIKEGIAVAQNETHIKPVLFVLAETPYALGNGELGALADEDLPVEKIWAYLKTATSNNPDAKPAEIRDIAFKHMISESKWLSASDQGDGKAFVWNMMNDFAWTFRGKDGQVHFDKWIEATEEQEKNYKKIDSIISQVVNAEGARLEKRFRFLENIESDDAENIKNSMKQLSESYKQIEETKFYVLAGESQKDFISRIQNILDEGFVDKVMHKDIASMQVDLTNVGRGFTIEGPWQSNLEKSLKNYWNSSQTVNKINMFDLNFSQQGNGVLKPRLEAAGYEVVTLPIYGKSSMDNASKFIEDNYSGRDIEIAVLGHAGGAYGGENYGQYPEWWMSDEDLNSLKFKKTDDKKIIANDIVNKYAEVSGNPFIWQQSFDNVKNACNVTGVYLGSCGMGKEPESTAMMGSVFGAPAFGYDGKWGTEIMTKNPKTALEAMFAIEKGGVNTLDNVNTQSITSLGEVTSPWLEDEISGNAGWMSSIFIKKLYEDKKTLGITPESVLEVLNMFPDPEDGPPTGSAGVPAKAY